MPEKECPCQAVKELQKTVYEHDKELNKGNTNFALIQKDLEYIKAQLDNTAQRKEKLGMTAVTSIFSIISQLAVAAIALYLGLK